MNPFRLILKVRRNYIDHGIRITLRKLIGSLVSPIYANYTYRIYRIELANLNLRNEKLDQRFLLRMATPDDTHVIEQIEKMEEWLRGQIKNKLLSKNHVCVISMDGQKLTGFNLIDLKHGHIPNLKLKWELDEGEAWSEQITVGKEYRRQGLGLILRKKAFAELRDRGIKSFSGGALKSNKKSLMLANRAGYNFTEDIQYLNIFGLKKWYRNEVAK